MHSAFVAETVVDELPLAIECLEAQEDTLLAGARDGTLIVIGQDVQEGDAPAPLSAPWHLLEAHKMFARRPLLQLRSFGDVAPANGPATRYLISVTDEGAVVHRRTPGSRTAYDSSYPVPKTRGANMIAWEPEHHLLAVAVRRRLHLFHYANGKCTELREIGLPDVVKAMVWVSGDCICLALRKEYLIADANTGALSDLCSAGSAQHPAVLRLSTGEIMVNKDGAGVFLNRTGKITRKVVMSWSEPPSHLATSLPYALAVVPAKQLVEVRSLTRTSQHGLVQILPVPGDIKAFTATDDGSVVVASATRGAVLRLYPVSITEQIQDLASQKDFQEALNLCHHLPSEDEAQLAKRHQVEDSLHLQFGEHLYRQKEFEEALAHLGMCKHQSSVHILQLFPSLAPQLPETRKKAAAFLETGSSLGQQREDSAGETDLPKLSPEEKQRAMSMVLPYLMTYRGRLANSCDGEEQGGGTTAASSHSPSDGNSELGLRAMLVDTAIMQAMLGMNDTGALLGFVQRSNLIDLAEGEKALTEAGRYSELVALYEANACHDKSLDLLSRLSQDPGSLAVPPQGAASELLGLPGVWAAVRYCVRVGSSNPDLVLEFSAWILQADPENGIEMFMEMDPPMPPAKVLSHLRSAAPSICAPYLEAAIQRGIAPPTEYHSELVLIYLQEGLAHANLNKDSTEQPQGGDTPNHTVNDLPEDCSTAPEVLGGSRAERMERLQSLICSSSFLNLEQVLSWVPKGSLLEVRAVLLQRLGKTKEVLALFVRGMENMALAEEYCDFLYDHYAILQGDPGSEQKMPPRPATRGPVILCPPDTAADTSPSVGRQGSTVANQPDVYLHLLQVMLGAGGHARSQPSGAAVAMDSNVMSCVAQVLIRKQHRINPIVALSLLPAEVPLAEAAPFLESALRSMGEEAHNVAIVKNLRRSENLQVREELVQCRQRRVVVSSERACVICLKRIGNSVFAAYPDNTLVHFACYKRSVASSHQR